MYRCRPTESIKTTRLSIPQHHSAFVRGRPVAQDGPRTHGHCQIDVMDAQNAARSDTAKPPVSPTRPAVQSGDTADKPSLKVSSATPAAQEDLKSSNVPDEKTISASSAPSPDDNNNAADRDSDAETIVLPGKDGHSPSKIRKVKHEDHSDSEDLHVPQKRRDTEHSKAPDRARNSLGGSGHGKKNAAAASDKGSLRPERPSRNHDGSSGLSSAPTSPPNHRRRPVPPHDSESDGDRKRSPKLPDKDRARSTDQLSSHKRKASRVASDDDHAEERKAARRRRFEDRPDWLASKEKSASSREAKTGHREQRASSSKWSHDNHNGRSVSPPARPHRRSVSTQLPSNAANGLSYKKKRLPAPLRSTEYHSDDSSASGSPHPRNHKVRNLSTPATADSNTSPAKMPSGKRHVDAHGQTPLARACNKGELEVAKQRLMERPDDIDFADHAGNTPLQSAAINGYENIVKLLIDAGCNVNCVNDQKDTPLLDAVENGHLDVVKLLLAAGVNPRRANLEGQEPIDIISDELDNAEEIRAALVEAKNRKAETRKTSEEIHGDHLDGSSHGADSPRQSPAPPPHGRRPGTVRAQKIGNHHLYVNLDDRTLRLAAAKGDEETVTRVLQVKDRCDDPGAMVAAAKAGHEVVVQLLLALGNADPDPEASSSQGEFSTPILAAIGQENIKVVQLLLDQSNFDPTRKFRGLTYYEIAEKRQGTNWKEEEQLLKEAYDAYALKKSRGETNKNKSPRRERARAQERDAARSAARAAPKDESRAPRRNASSPTRDSEVKKKSIQRTATSPKEKRRSQSFSQHDEQKLGKRGHSRPKKDDHSAPATGSDREASPATMQKLIAKPRKQDSDIGALSSEGETAKPRRKLVSKGELRGEREKQRRTSMASNTSSLREPLSPRNDDPSDKTKEPLSEKYHDRTKALKGDESRERPAGDMSGKRHRSSVTPPHSGNGEKDHEGPVKRRRLDLDGKERRVKGADSHDERKASRELSKSKPTDRDGDKPKHHTDGELTPRGNGKLNTTDKSAPHIKTEQDDVDMLDAPTANAAEDKTKKRLEQEAAHKRREAEAEAEMRRKKAEEERQQRVADEQKREDEVKQKEVERLKREEEESRRREEETMKRKVEDEKRRAEEEARSKREAEEAKRREDEARQAREEEEARQREEEAKRAEEEEERKRKEKEEQRQREEEELRKQQLEREQARRQREEDERKEREVRERQKREEAERKRAAHEAETRRQREEDRQQRLAKLPPLLRWLDGCENPQTTDIAKKFAYLIGVRYDTIRPETLGTPLGREQCILNINAALLLGIKDVELSGFTAWERLPASDIAKRSILMLEADRHALTGPDLRDLGAQLPGYYGDDEDPSKLHPQTMIRLRKESAVLFKKTDMFFVKVRETSLWDRASMLTVCSCPTSSTSSPRFPTSAM